MEKHQAGRHTVRTSELNGTEECIRVVNIAENVINLTP